MAISFINVWIIILFMRRAQIEIVGMVIIVILIVIIAVVFLMFRLTPQSSNIDNARYKLFGANLVNAIGKYTPCGESDMKKILEDCYLNLDVCGKDACELVKEEVPKIMNSLGWDKPYYFNYLLNNQSIVKINDPCKYGITYDTPISTGPEGTFFVNIKFCSNTTSY